MNLYMMLNVFESTYEAMIVTVQYIHFLISQHIRGKEIIKQRIPKLHKISEICSMTW